MAERSPLHGALGRAIRHVRVGRGISQEELGFRSGLHPTYVGGIERGERNPSYTSLMRLADALDVPLATLITDAENPATPPTTSS